MSPNPARLAIHSVPRSGSTWLGEIFNSSPTVRYLYQPLFSYALKDFLGPHPNAGDVDRFFDALATTEDDFMLQRDARARGILPTFEKDDAFSIVYKEVRYMHILEGLMMADPNLKLVGLIRSPLGVLASWKSAPKEFHPDWTFSEEWRYAHLKNNGRPENFFGFEKWLETCHLFTRLAERYPDRVTLVRYIDLLRDTASITHGLFEFSGLSVGPQTQTFLNESAGKSINDTYSVFRQKSSDEAWKTRLSDQIVEEVTRLTHEAGFAKYLENGADSV